MDAPQPQLEMRGVELILEHCAALDRLSHSRRAASERLTEALGDAFAHVLVQGLTARPRRRAA